MVVNFDPDTAGAKATERTLGLLVEEEFQIKVLTLESGFDPDLFIRRKGKDAYADALKNSQKYFDYLIERARTQFPVRSAEGKVKAVNYLLPHIQRVPSRIVRDELAREMAQKLGIDSSVLRQELKHAAANRSTASLKAPAEVQVTDAEKILIRALASATEMQTSEEHLSARDGAEEEFDPVPSGAVRPQEREPAPGTGHRIADRSPARAQAESVSVTDLPLPDADRNLLASILMKDDEELTAGTPGRGGARACGASNSGESWSGCRGNCRPREDRRPDRLQALAAGKNAAEAGPDGPQPGRRRPRGPARMNRARNTMKLNEVRRHLS